MMLSPAFAVDCIEISCEARGVDDFGPRLKALRKFHGKSQSDLSDETTQDKRASFGNYVSRVERGKVNPSLDFINRVAAKLSYVRLSEFFLHLEYTTLAEWRALVTSVGTADTKSQAEPKQSETTRAMLGKDGAAASGIPSATTLSGGTAPLPPSSPPVGSQEIALGLPGVHAIFEDAKRDDHKRERDSGDRSRRRPTTRKVRATGKRQQAARKTGHRNR